MSYQIRSDALHHAVELVKNGAIKVSDVVPTAESFNKFLDDTVPPAPPTLATTDV